MDIQGGMQVVLRADVSVLLNKTVLSALESARNIILRRVDLYGAEPTVQTAMSNNEVSTDC